MKIKQKTMMNLFGWSSRTTIYEWSKDDNRKVLKLIEAYFSEKDVEEFLKNGIITKLENNQQAIALQKKIYDDVINLVQKKQSLKAEHPEKKIFFTFGKFLENGLDDKDKMWIKSLKFEEYIKFEDNTDDFFKEKYIQFLESQELNTLEMHNHLTAMEYIHFRTSNHYKFYFLKYAMWLLIPTKMEEIELEKVSKYQEIPEYIRKIPGTKKISNFITIMSHASEVIYGK